MSGRRIAQRHHCRPFSSLPSCYVNAHASYIAIAPVSVPRQSIRFSCCVLHLGLPCILSRARPGLGTSATATLPWILVVYSLKYKGCAVKRTCRKLRWFDNAHGMLSGLRQALSVCRVRGNTLFTRMIEMNIANADQPSLAALKKELRQTVKARLKKLDPATKSRESGIIQGIVKDTSIFARAQALGIYVHCDKLNEVDTSELLTETLTRGTAKVYVPVVQDKDANMQFLHLDSQEGLRPVPPFNILEPTPTYCDGRPRENVMQADSPLDVLFVPGLAFDGKGHRLGRGGGYYDKFLETYLQLAKSKSWTPPLIVGLGFRSQLVDAVPVGPTDRNLDCLITPDGAIVYTDCHAAISPAKLLQRD